MIRTSDFIRRKRGGAYHRHTSHRNVGVVDAYVNHGRWIASCECGGAEMVHEDDPFECASCGGRGTVRWPSETGGIEEALARRPIVHQNWLPSESMADLRSQNILMGVD